MVIIKFVTYIAIFVLTSVISKGAFAAMKFELDYPILGDDVVPVDKFIEFAFRFALGTAGAVALGVLIFGGIKYITSAGNPSGQGDAKKWIQDAILGLLLLLGSFLILNTINPDLVNIGEPAPGTISVEHSEDWYLTCIGLVGNPNTCGCQSSTFKPLSQGDPCMKPFDSRIVPEMIPMCGTAPWDICVTRPSSPTEVEVFCCGLF